MNSPKRRIVHWTLSMKRLRLGGDTQPVRVPRLDGDIQPYLGQGEFRAVTKWKIKCGKPYGAFGSATMPFSIGSTSGHKFAGTFCWSSLVSISASYTSLPSLS